MMTAIHTLSDVVSFAEYLVHEEKLIFYPAEDFHNYVTSDGRTFLSTEKAKQLNELMNQAFLVCLKFGKNVYLVMGEPVGIEYTKVSGMDTNLNEADIQLLYEGREYMNQMCWN